MANVIKPKRSNTAAAVPTTGQLAGGEIAVNMADRKIWINNGTAVVQVGAGNLSALGDVVITSPSNGDVIQYNSSSSTWINGGVVASTASNISGGATNQIVYQTGTNTTNFITAPTTGDTYLKWTGSAFSWASVSGTGDMAKATYDTNNNGKVDSAETADAVPWTGITGKPTFAAVATSGLYSDLSGTPVIGTNIQAWSSNLDSWSAISTTSKQDTLTSGTNIKSIDGTSLLGSGDYTVLPTVGQATGDIHGVVTRSASTLSFNEGTRTFTIAPVSGSWTFYNKGTLYTISTSKSLQIADVSGTTFIRFNINTLELEQYGPIPDFTNDVIVAYIYWNATTQKCIILGDERHGSKRDTTWHSNQHLNVGTVWRSGGGLTYTLNNASSVQLGVGTPLVLADEDLAHTINHSATPTADYEQVLNTAASLEVLYLNGTSYTATTQSTTPWIAGTSLARYNFVTGGSGSLVDAAEGKYITYWLLGTNDTRRPVKLVLGRAEHSSIDAAYAEEFTEYGLSFAEQVFMYQIVVQTSASYTANAAKIVVAGVRKVLSKVSTSASTVSATQHNVLTGRESADAHPIASITNLQTALDGKQATLVSNTNIKTVNNNSLLGSGNIAVQEVLVSNTNIKTVNSNSLLGSGDIAVQEVLTSGTNIKSINGNSLLGSGDLTIAGSSQSVSATITAGTNTQGQGALTSDYNIVTSTPNNPSAVTLPTATAGRTIKIVNKGTNAVNIYPATGAQIDALGTNAFYDLPVNAIIEVNASSTTQWYSTGNTDITRLGSIFINEFTTTVTSGTAVTLTNDSSYYQEFTGTTAQTVLLPNATTSTAGLVFEIINNSTATLTVQTSTAATIATVPPSLAAKLVLSTTAFNTTASWEFEYSGFATITGTGNNVLSVAPTLSSLSLAAGTATAGTAPLKLTSGVNLTAAEAGAIEFDGATLYGTANTTNGRGFIPLTYYYRLAANGANIGAAIADFFGANSSIPLVANGIYEIDIEVYYTKNTAGTVVWTLTNSTTVTNMAVNVQHTAVAGYTAVPTATAFTVAALVNQTAAAVAFSATASLTNNTNHIAKFRIILENGSSTSLRLRATSSAGTITPLRNSRWKATRVANASALAA